MAGRRHRWLDLLTAAAWGCVAATAILLVTQALRWNGFAQLAALQALTPYVIVGLVPICIVAGALRAPALAASAAALGLAGLWLALPFAIAPSQRPPLPDAHGLRVASVNLLFSNPSVEEVADDLVARELDIIVFIEYTEPHEATLESHPLVERFPHRLDHNDPKARGMALWSRYPIVDPTRRGATSFGINVNIEGPDGDVRVMGVHPPTPVWNFRRWLDAIDLIAARALNNGPPTLVIGDFNASYWNPKYRELLDRGFVDAHLAVGNRLDRSWPTDKFFPPIAQIDRAILGDGLVALSMENFDVPGSDHRGVLVTVAPAR